MDEINHVSDEGEMGVSGEGDALVTVAREDLCEKTACKRRSKG